MSFAKVFHSKSDPGGQQHAPHRPTFNSHITSDRLRESSRLPVVPMASNIRKGRKSIFREMGLDQEGNEREVSASFEEREFGEITGLNVEPTPATDQTLSSGNEASKGRTRWLSKLASARHPRIKTAASAPPPTAIGLHRLPMIALLIAVLLPAISYNNGRKKVEVSGADAGVIKKTPAIVLERQQNSPTEVCTRWAGQSAVLNGTLYFYGGRSKSTGSQTSDTWNNDFIALDLTRSWDINSPALNGLPQPSGPPAVSLGYLWNDLNHLFLYGGEFSDDPIVQPLPVSTWMYDIASETWSEFRSPQTSSGNYSDPEGMPVQRAAEGAGISVPELGISWYFGGHLNWATTPEWSNQTDIVYLKSLLEFTHPGYANTGVDTLHTSGAPDGGAYRNITWGGIQNQNGFTERADGVLVYVPGWGPNGVLLGLGGGSRSGDDTTDAFASMSTIDVYDIKTSQWYHQQTSGEAPQVRVNPCAVIFSAPDASSFNIYMYGGQNLLPYGQQIQYTDVWILTIPSFTWIKADINGNEPPARAGHQCAARDGQMVIVGGYVGENIPCDSPGIYNFDASLLQWKDSFSAAGQPADSHPDNSVLAGSYGYRVPEAVQSVIGGSSDGGATATEPASGPATDGPFKTGTPPVFTITAPASTATITGGVSSIPGDPAPSGANTGTIAAGVIAGLAGLTALYLGFCAWLWRRQVRAYRRHMAVANRYNAGGGITDDGEDSESGGGGGGAGGLVAAREKLRKSHHHHHRRGSLSVEDNHFGWVGQPPPPPPPSQYLSEPTWMTSSDEASPGSGGSAPPALGRHRPSEDRSPWGYDGYIGRAKSAASRSTGSGGSAEALLDGRQPNFFSVVLGPRRALRVVNGLEE
ncbi:hypothetical protein F4809DRAFT_636885 [Biscogniauxia mediterranea]|nr:hypothetical protein F4809DRAFT_636885 [Biscogniauxia mediterranea]